MHICCTPPLSWCQHPNFQLGVVPHIALILRWEAGPSPKVRRWILVGLSMCSLLNALGRSDWRVSLGSICWRLLRRKICCSFTEAISEELSFLTGIGCPFCCRQPSCGQEGRRSSGGQTRAEGRVGRRKETRVWILRRAPDHTLLKPILPLDFSVMRATKFS